MNKAISLAVAMLSIWVTVAFADRVDLTLGWNACRVNGIGAAKGACFACDTEVGSNQLVAAILPNAASNLVGLSAVDCYIDIQTDHPFTLPAWWQFADPPTGQPGCRALSTQLTTDATNAAALDCDYTYWPQVVGGLPMVWGAGYRYPSDVITQPTHAKFRVIVAVDKASAASTRQPAAGEETYLFSARLSRGSTLVVPGQPSCAGCATRVFLTFYRLDVFQSNDDNFQINNNVFAPSSAYWSGSANPSVTWQIAGDCQVPTANQNRTWGSIKGIYR